MKRIIVLIIATTVVASCSKSQDEGGKNIALIGGNDIQHAFADDTSSPRSVSFTTAGEWSSLIYCDEALAPTWITITPTRASEAGDYTIDFGLRKNFTGLDRTATIKFICNGDQITITITQDARTSSGEIPTNPVQSINLDKHDLTIEKGESVTLVATILPEDATTNSLIWTSFDPNIITVDEAGVVHALNPGTTIVTVKSAADDTKYDHCNVTVPNHPVVGATMNITTLTIEKFDTETLFVNFMPANATNQKLTWSNSNPDVISFEDNDNASKVVTANRTGTATITAVSEDGDIESQCLVTVIDNTSNGSGTIALGFSDISSQEFHLRYAHYTVEYNAAESRFQYLLYLETNAAPDPTSGKRPSITVPFYVSSSSDRLAAGTYSFGSNAYNFQEFNANNLELKMHYFEGTIIVTQVGDQYTIAFDVRGRYPGTGVPDEVSGELVGSYTGKIKPMNARLP